MEVSNGVSLTAIVLIALGLAMDAFAVSVASGIFIGNTVGHFFERKLEALGGLILIGIGIKILLEHLR